MKRPYYNIKVCFGITLIAIIGSPLLFAKIHLFYFAPFLVICFYRLSRYALLWQACLCGIIVDLLSSNSLFGITALNYSLVCFFLYGQKRNFFEEKLSTLPLMTFLFSFFSTLLSPLCALFANRGYPLSIAWVVTDLFGMPAMDALYALLVFSLPVRLYSSRLVRRSS